MEAKDLRINQLIEVTVDEDDSDYRHLASRIEEITDDHLHISVPMRKGELLPLRVGQYLIINFIIKGHSYVFNTIIVNRRLNPLPILIIQKPTQISEIQRRQWVRVPAKLPLRFRASAHEKDVKPSEGNSLDISGGGILFLTADAVEDGQIIELEINLPNRTPVFCKAKILRTVEKASQIGQPNKVILEYYEISEGHRDKIVNYIFEKQREWIRKGVL